MRQTWIPFLWNNSPRLEFSQRDDSPGGSVPCVTDIIISQTDEPLQQA